MVRRFRNICLGLVALLFGMTASFSYAQTDPALIDALLNASQISTNDPDAVRKTIAQMDEYMKNKRAEMIDNKPVFDGKNLIMNIHGVTYTFDITVQAQEARVAFTTLRTTPPVPRAYEAVTIQVESFSTDLIEDRITWTVDGTVVQDDIGGSSIRINMGAIGEEKRIIATIFSRKHNQLFSKELVLVPGDVAVLWEANTYIPPFYKGKPLPSYMSTIKLVPFPTILAGGKSVPHKNLVYRWKQNYRNVKEISGYGKPYSFIQAGGGTREERLKLSVSHPESGGETEREIIIGIVEPKILLYAGSPLQGTRYEEALKRDYPLTTQETTLRAEPFYFSREELNTGASPLHFTQNGKPIPSLYDSIVLQRQSGQGGSSRVDVSITNPSRILQSARAGVNIVYQNTAP